MAPWPEQGNEPKAPDKSCNKSSENSSIEVSKVILGNSEDTKVNATTSKCDDKQAEDRDAHVSNLDDGQLRALLDEAIAYKCPKDREGKSHLFRELLQEAEANEDGDSQRGLSGVCGSRYYSNSSRRRGRRDAQVSERQTRGGSLQNLVHASNSEFDPAAGFSGYHSGGSRSTRRSKRLSTGSALYSGTSVGSSCSSRDCAGVSVSARQREGGSLPSNVNVGGMLTLGLEYQSTPSSLPFDDIKTCKQVATRRKELIHSSSSNEFSSMPVQTSTINSSSSGSGSVESGGAVSSLSSNCTAPKAEFMVLDLGEYGGETTGPGKSGSGGNISISSNITSVSSGCVDNGTPQDEKVVAESNGTEPEGRELEVLQRAELTTCVPNYTSRATLEVGHSEGNKVLPSSSVIASEGTGDVDATVTFPLEILQCSEKSSSAIVNGVEQNSLQLRSSYNSVKSIMSSGNSCTGPRDEKSNVNKGNDIAKRSAGSESVGKGAAASALTSASNVATSAMPMLSMQHHLSVLSLPPTSWINTPLVPDVNRLTFTHGSSKDCSGESKNQNKSLDENGNAVNRLESATSNSTERKGKQRKTKTNNDRNVIMSQNIEGYRGDKDLDTVLKFIESNSDGKGTNKAKSTSTHSNGPMNFNSKQQRNCSRLIGCDRTKARRERGLEEPGVDEGKSRTSTSKHIPKENRGKGNKLKKSNSLEEISKTKLEDLTADPKESDNEVGSSVGNTIEEAPSLLRRPKKQSTVDNGVFYVEKGRVGDRRSWGTEEGQQYYCNDGVTVSADECSSGSGQINRKRRGNNIASNIISSDEKRKMEREDSGTPVLLTTAGASGANEEADFLVVTKKQKRKKRRSSSGGRGTSASTAGSIFGDDGWRHNHNNYGTSYYQNRENAGGSYYQRKTFTNTTSGFPPHDRTVERDSGGVMLYTQYRHHRPRSPDHLRRKSTSSMPPSDKSDSSDLDSVHSLPVSSTTQKLTLDQTSTSSGSTPQASYADIARMASSNVPSAPTHSSNYVNINLNSSRWPMMGVPKNAVVPNPVANPATTVTVLSTSSALTTSNSNVTVPVVSSNPQFITGPKINIGVPPVSGSKLAVFPGNNQSGMPYVNPGTVPILPDDTNQGSMKKESEAVCGSPTEIVSAGRPRLLSSPTDSRPKKDAMTNTNSDYNTVSSSGIEEKELSHAHEVSLKSSDSGINFFKDGEYPSIEESLACDKAKNIKIAHVNNSHSSTGDSISAILPVVNSSPPKDNPLNTSVVSDCEKDCVVDDKRSQVFVTNQSVGAGCSTVVSSVTVPTLTLPSTKTCVPDSVSSAVGCCGQSNDGLEDAKTKDGLPSKTKNVCKKVSSSGNRPPVIILDESDQNFSYSDGLVTISELTFGFEVNEQLLMPEGDEDLPEAKTLTVIASDSNSVVIEDVRPVPSSSVLIPLSSCSVGDNFSTRYREPPTQPDNHDKIVTFVGLAWDDILKEMNGMSVHSGAKVQYYTGQ